MKNIEGKKIESLNNITDIILKEKSYLSIAKSFCENEMSKSEQLADIFNLISDINKIHDQLYETFDEFVINYISLTDPK